MRVKARQVKECSQNVVKKRVFELFDMMAVILQHLFIFLLDSKVMLGGSFFATFNHCLLTTCPTIVITDILYGYFSQNSSPIGPAITVITSSAKSAAATAANSTPKT